MGFIAVMNDLHKGRDTGNAWGVLIDASAMLMTLVSLTGLLLIFFLPKKRSSGLLAAVAGIVLCCPALRGLGALAQRTGRGSWNWIRHHRQYRIGEPKSPSNRRNGFSDMGSMPSRVAYVKRDAFPQYGHWQRLKRSSSRFFMPEPRSELILSQDASCTVGPE